MWPFPPRTYTREELLERAGRARARGRLRAAIADYRRVLEQEPDDPVVLGRMAPLLARTRQPAAAWTAFRAAAERLRAKGFVDKAIALCAQATGLLPRLVESWQLLADLLLERGHAPDAVDVLVRGHYSFAGPRDRPRAIELLSRAVLVDPSHFEARLQLARQLGKSGQKESAALLLGQLAAQAGLSADRSRLSRVRAAQWWLEPSFGSAWRWLAVRLSGR